MKIDNIISFALEGPDKVGKATQSKMLCDALVGLSDKFNLKGVDVRVHRVEIPSRSHACYDKVYDMLVRRDNGSAPAVDHAEVFQTFQVANRFHVQSDLQTMGEQGRPTIIIFDRWVLSSWAYGLSSGVSAEKIGVINDGLLKPEITFVLHGKSFDRPEQEDDAYEDDDSFQAKVRKNYESISSGYSENWNHTRSIDANRDMDVVHNDILAIVKGELQRKGIL